MSLTITTPDPTTAQGWLTGTNGRAHHFNDGHSACHRWFATIVDRPAKPEDARCEVCVEVVSREF